MYKHELAKLAGVSTRTFRRYLATRCPILTAMGISPFAQKLPPSAVRFISEDYCIDLPPQGAALSPFPRGGDSGDVKTHREPEGQRLESDTKTLTEGGFPP